MTVKHREKRRRKAGKVKVWEMREYESIVACDDPTQGLQGAVRALAQIYFILTFCLCVREWIEM